MSHRDTDRRLKPGVHVRVKDGVPEGGQSGTVLRRGRNRDGVYYEIGLASGTAKFHCSWLEPTPLCERPECDSETIVRGGIRQCSTCGRPA